MIFELLNHLYIIGVSLVLLAGIHILLGLYWTYLSAVFWIISFSG